MERYLLLGDVVREGVQAKRRAHDRLTVAVQLTNVRGAWDGSCRTCGRRRRGRRYLAEQLEITGRSCPERYGERDGRSRRQPGRSRRRGRRAFAGSSRCSFQLPGLAGGLRPRRGKDAADDEWGPVAEGGHGQCGLRQFVGRYSVVAGVSVRSGGEGHHSCGRLAAGRWLPAAGCGPDRPPCQGTVRTILPRAWPVALTS